MKRILIIFISSLLILTVFTGCGSSKSSTQEVKMGSVTKGDTANTADMKRLSPEADGQTSDLADGKKIVKTAALGVEAEDALAAYNKLLVFTQTNGGYEFSKNISKESQHTIIHASLRIPPVQLDALLDYASLCGEVVNSTVDSEDITDQYTDTQIRLNTMSLSLERYYELIKTAATVDEVLKIQGQIDKITADIESAEGKLASWNKRLAESYVELTIREQGDPVKISKTVSWRTMSFSDMGLLIRNGCMNLYNGLALGIQWLIVFLVILLPIVLILGLLALIFLKFKKIKRSKIQENQDKHEKQ